MRVVDWITVSKELEARLAVVEVGVGQFLRHAGHMQYVVGVDVVALGVACVGVGVVVQGLRPRIAASVEAVAAAVEDVAVVVVDAQLAPLPLLEADRVAPAMVDVVLRQADQDGFN